MDDSMVELGRLDVGRAWCSARSNKLHSFSIGNPVSEQRSHNQGMVLVADNQPWSPCCNVSQCHQSQSGAGILSIRHHQLLHSVLPCLDLVSCQDIKFFTSFQYSVWSFRAFLQCYQFRHREISIRRILLGDLGLARSMDLLWLRRICSSGKDVRSLSSTRVC